MSASLHGRLLAAAALVAVLVGSGGAAYADQVTNNLDGSVDAVAEVMPLNVGGADGNTVLRVLPANGDNKNGCNLTGSTTATFSVASSAGSVATVSPGTVTFDSCETTAALTVTAHAVGTATVSLTQTSNTTDGSFNLAPASFTVNVAGPANTAPVVDVTGVQRTSYELGVDTLPTPGCAASDAEDGPSSPAPTIVHFLDAFDLGTVEVTCSYTDDGGLTAISSKSYTVVDTIAPVIVLASRTPAANANGWNNGDVTVTWACSDAGVGVVDATVSETTGGEGSDLFLTGLCEDKVGHTASNSVSGIKVDLTDPEIVISRSPAANDAGWNNGDVTVAWTCTDALSEATDAGDFRVLVEGADQSVTGTCTDRAGNTASDVVTNVDVDKTAPLISIGRSPSANAAGWNNGDVIVAWECTDALSGATDAGGSTVLGEGSGQSAGGTCTDLAGNTSDNEVTGVNVDKTAPSVSWTGPIPDGAEYYFGSVPAAPGCSASDALSGLVGSCTVAGHSTTVGTHVVTATAVDKAGNETATSSRYTVLAWTVNGFYQPVDMNGVWNTVKNGSTVPLKFEVFMGSAEITDVATLGATFTVKGVACPGAGAATDDVELTATGGTTFRYDASGGQFIQNWQTPKKTGACYEVITTTADGSRLSALFKLK